MDTNLVCPEQVIIFCILYYPQPLPVLFLFSLLQTAVYAKKTQTKTNPTQNKPNPPTNKQTIPKKQTQRDPKPEIWKERFLSFLLLHGAVLL